jgi:hypothetical protein
MARPSTTDSTDSHALAEMCEWLDRYLDAQGDEAASLRHVVMPADPWPADDNPMLAYLLRRAQEITRSDGAPTAMTWLAVHAWFEGALADRSRCSRDEGSLS